MTAISSKQSSLIMVFFGFALINIVAVMIWYTTQHKSFLNDGGSSKLIDSSLHDPPSLPPGNTLTPLISIPTLPKSPIDDLLTEYFAFSDKRNDQNKSSEWNPMIMKEIKVIHKIFAPIMQSPGYHHWELQFHQKYSHLTFRPPSTRVEKEKDMEIHPPYQPTVDEPFFFFHLPKTGGTSLREFLFRDYFKSKKTVKDTVVKTSNNKKGRQHPNYSKTMHSVMKEGIGQFDGIIAPCYQVDCDFNMTKPTRDSTINATSCGRVFLGHFYPFQALSNLLRIQVGLVEPSPPPAVLLDTKDVHSRLPREVSFCSRWASLIGHSATTIGHTTSDFHGMIGKLPSVDSSIKEQQQPMVSATSIEIQTERLKQLLQSRDLTGQDPIFWQLLDKIRCITVLRNPFQRAISGYYEFGYPLTNLTLTEYLNRNSVRDFLWVSTSYVNAQTAILGGELDPFKVDRQTLLNAQKVLHQCIVGIQEDMPTFVNMVSMALSFPSLPPGAMGRSSNVVSLQSSRLGHYNSLKDKNSTLQAERQTFNSTHFRELVRPYLSLDYELWLYAKEIVIKRQKEVLFRKDMNLISMNRMNVQNAKGK